MKLGIILENLGASQLAYYTIKEINNWLKNNPSDDIIVFYDTLSKICLEPKCAIMQINEAWGFHGPMIATSLKSAAKLISFPTPSPKLYYAWDLDWLRPYTTKDFTTLHNIYSNPELKFIARSGDHANAINKCWNRDIIGIVNNVSMKEMFICLNQQ